MSSEATEVVLERTSPKSPFFDQVAKLVRGGVSEDKARDMVAAKEWCIRLRSELARVKQKLEEANRRALEAEQKALTDDLTELLSREGFKKLGKEQLKIASRVERRVWVLFADLDGLKVINDALGHPQGDRALQDTADRLKETFRESDLIAHLHGDEFAILAVETDEDLDQKEIDPVQVMIDRLQEKIDKFNQTSGRKYNLSLSIGAELRGPKDTRSLDELLGTADEKMYRRKRAKDLKRDDILRINTSENQG